MRSGASPRPVRCVLWGFGRVNQAVLELSLERPWIVVVGVLIRPQTHQHERPSDFVRGADPSLTFESDPAAVFDRVSPDVTIIATKSRLLDVVPQIRCAAKSRAILCTAEELSYLEPTDGPLALEVCDIGVEHGTSIVPVGLNPGFVLDLWPLVASSVAWDVKHISARRIVNVSVFGPTVRRNLGIGLTVPEFEAGLADGTVAGHLGFRESLRIIASQLGVPVDIGPVTTRPIVASQPVDVADFVVPAGRTVGAEQWAMALVKGKPWVELNLTLHIAPHLDGLQPVDELRIDGRNDVHVRISGGLRPVLGTAALLVNSVPGALRASPGYHPIGSLPPSTPWLAERPPSGFS